MQQAAEQQTKHVKRLSVIEPDNFSGVCGEHNKTKQGAQLSKIKAMLLCKHWMCKLLIQFINAALKDGFTIFQPALKIIAKRNCFIFLQLIIIFPVY